METNHNREVRRGGKGVVFKRGERWIYKRMGEYKKQISHFNWEWEKG